MPADPPELSDADDALIMIIRAIKKYARYDDPADAVATAISVLDGLAAAGLAVIRAAKTGAEYGTRHPDEPDDLIEGRYPSLPEWAGNAMSPWFVRDVHRTKWRPVEGSQT